MIRSNAGKALHDAAGFGAEERFLGFGLGRGFFGYRFGVSPQPAEEEVINLQAGVIGEGMGEGRGGPFELAGLIK